MKAKFWCSVQKARIQILIIALVNLLLQIPKWLSEYVTINPDGSGTKTYKTELGAGKAYALYYDTIMYVTVNHLVPFPCLLWMTYQLMSSLKKAKERRAQLTRRDVNDLDLTRTLVAVVVVYIVCQTPNPIRRLLKSLLPRTQRGCGYFYYYYHSMSTTILVTNSAINFLLYYGFGKKFRSNFAHRSRYLFGRTSQVAPASTTESTTGAGTGSVGSQSQQQGPEASEVQG